MLSRADLDLVRRDGAIKGLATVLDAGAFLDALRARLPGIALEGARGRYLRYKPGTRCLAAFDVRVGGCSWDVHATAQGPDAAEKGSKEAERPTRAGPLGAGRVTLQEQDISVSVFPNDRRLPALTELADRSERRHLLSRLFPDRPDLFFGRFERLAYKPERRYVSVLRTEAGRQAVFKLYTPAGYAMSLRNARALRSKGDLRIASVIARSKRKGIVALEWMAGRTLAEASDPEALFATGRALAALHFGRAGELPVRTRETERLAARAAAEEIGFLRPEAAPRAAEIARRIEAGLAREPAVIRPIHGDFYDAQVLRTRCGVAFLDLDEACFGDPAADLGRFLAQLGTDRAAESAGQAAALLEGYRATASPPTPRRVALYTALGLLLAAPHHFRARQKDWAQRLWATLERASTALEHPADGGERGGSPTPCRRHSEPRPGRSKRPVASENLKLARALDPGEMQRQLQRHLPRSFAGSSLLAARIISHKPGRRCLIEYELEMDTALASTGIVTIVGKARARGLDGRMHRVLTRLWQGDFDAQSSDGISVPEPLAVLPDLAMTLQRKVSGHSAAVCLRRTADPALARRIASAAHKLHGADLRPDRSHTSHDEMRILEKQLAEVARLRPSLAPRLARIVAGCRRLAFAIPPVEPTGIHRDFHPDQVLVDGARLTLLDFDLFCAGDPALDIGNFSAHLCEHALREYGDPAALWAIQEALEEHFLELSGLKRRAAIRAYATLSLARHIAISNRIEARKHTTRALLELCEEKLGLAGVPWRATPRPPRAPAPSRI